MAYEHRINFRHCSYRMLCGLQAITRGPSRLRLIPLTLLLLSACSSLPVIKAGNNAEFHPRHNTATRLAGIHGLLSAEQSKAILDSLKRTDSGADFLDLHLAVEERIVGSPLTTSNKATLLQNGPSTYAAMMAAIESAHYDINMETYIFEDDEVGRKFADALINKQRQGVNVAVIRDSVGTLSTSNDFFTRLTAAGIKVLEFNPVNPMSSRKTWKLNQRDHRKLLVVDGQVAFLGGINISRVYSGSSFRRETKRRAAALPWRDTDVQLEGPIVGELQKLFLDTWNRQQGASLNTEHWFPAPKAAGSAVVRAIGGSPEEPFSLIYATLISAFQSAQVEIWITNAYFVPDPQLLAALKAAAARGVDVRLVLPSHTDSWLVLNASHSYYKELLKGGVKIYLRRDAMLHVKTAVVDGVWSTVGSTNLDWRSFLHNQEVNVVVLGSDFSNQMRAAFLDDIAHSDLLTLEQWQRRPLTAHFKELLGRLWEYWL